MGKSYFPKDNDLKDKYAGIGTAYNGVLLTEHFEGCLALHGKAQMLVPNEFQYKAEFLEGIKASASTNSAELTDFYSKLKAADLSEEKRAALLKTVQDYLR